MSVVMGKDQIWTLQTLFDLHNTGQKEVMVRRVAFELRAMHPDFWKGKNVITDTTLALIYLRDMGLLADRHETDKELAVRGVDKKKRRHYYWLTDKAYEIASQWRDVVIGVDA